MKLDDWLAEAPQPSNANEFLGGLRAMMSADDISANEKSAVAVGFLIGCTYALATSNEGDIKTAARTLIQLQGEWEAHGVL